MRTIYFLFVLYPLILINYKMRAKGLLADEWYWADDLACSWGMFTSGGKPSTPLTRGIWSVYMRIKNKIEMLRYQTWLKLKISGLI